MMSRRAFKRIFGLGPWLKGPDLVFAIERRGPEIFIMSKHENQQDGAAG